MSNYYFIYINQNKSEKKKVRKMCKIVHVAVKIVNECITQNIPINYFKTQKLAYLCQGTHLKTYGVPLAPEDVWNWSYGAGFKEIYAYFKKEGLTDTDEITTTIDRSGKPLDLLFFEEETIDEVIKKYASLSFEELRELKKYKNIEIGDIVPIEAIKEAFN